MMVSCVLYKSSLMRVNSKLKKKFILEVVLGNKAIKRYQ